MELMPNPKLTPSQKKIVSRIRKQFAPRDGYEVKEDEIKQLVDSRRIFLYYTTGLVDDEGTMAAIFARSRRRFCIGPRGKVETATKDHGWVPGITWDTTEN